MAEKLPSSSEREHALARWVEILNKSGRRAAEGLDPNPESASGLEHLLKHSHIPAARALATQKVPVARMHIRAAGSFKRGHDSRVLRVAFGVFAPWGDCRMKRVTVYQIEPLGLVGALTATDNLWESPSDSCERWDGIDPRPNRDLRARIEVVIAELRQWYIGFQSSSDFLTWWGQASAQYEEEHRQLFVLYADYSLTQPFGLREYPSGFRPTLDDEYRRRLLQLVERYQTTFRTILLSATEIRCSVVTSKSGTVKLPFLSESLSLTSRDVK